MPTARLSRSLVAAALVCASLGACQKVPMLPGLQPYRMDIQQGNRLEADAVEQVEVGMPQSAVQFLLGTPMLADPFHADRWDYPYYLRRGRSSEAERSWLSVYFENGRVTRIERDVELDPGS